MILRCIVGAGVGYACGLLGWFTALAIAAGLLVGLDLCTRGPPDPPAVPT